MDIKILDMNGKERAITEVDMQRELLVLKVNILVPDWIDVIVLKAGE